MVRNNTAGSLHMPFDAFAFLMTWGQEAVAENRHARGLLFGRAGVVREVARLVPANGEVLPSDWRGAPCAMRLRDDYRARRLQPIGFFHTCDNAGPWLEAEDLAAARCHPDQFHIVISTASGMPCCNAYVIDDAEPDQRPIVLF